MVEQEKKNAPKGMPKDADRPIRAILIDIDDTLLDFGESSKEAFSYAKRVTGYLLPPETYETFWRINGELWGRVEEGTLTKTELYHIRWKTIFEALGLPDLDGVRFEDAFYERLSGTAYPIKGAKELLAYLSSKYKIYAASNASHAQQQKRLLKAGLDEYLTAYFVSCDLGENKPAAAFFDKCFERMDGIKPEETVLIGDSLSADIAGGNAYGLLTIWYNHNRKPAPTDATLIPTFRVDSLAEILEIL